MLCREEWSGDSGNKAGGPADDAGLRPGDVILKSIGKKLKT